MSKSYVCTNCRWVGTPEEMDICGEYLICPDCCAEFNPHNPDEGPWLPLHSCESDQDFISQDWEVDDECD